jgi:hypothetical protein
VRLQQRHADRTSEAADHGADGGCGTPSRSAARRTCCSSKIVSFLFATPGVGEPAGGGFPAISLLGEFLLKDIPLLGLSFWTLADSIRAARRRAATTG